MPARLPLPRRSAHATLTALALAVVALIASACAQTPTAPASAPATTAPGPPQVMVTADILGDVTRAILGDQARVEVVVPTGADPRSYTPTADQQDAMNRAQLVVAVGLGFEAGAAAALADAREHGVTVLEIGPRLNPIPLGGSEAGARGAPAEGTSPATGSDPHVWLDPDRMVRATRLIVDGVASLPAVNAPVVERQRDAYEKRINRADEEVQSTLAPIGDDRRRLASTRDDIGYLADRYSFTIAAVGSTGTATSGSDDRNTEVGSLAAAIVAAAVPVLVTTPGTSAQPVVVAAAKAGATVTVAELDLEALGPPGGGADTYLGLLTTNAHRLAAAFA